MSYTGKKPSFEMIALEESTDNTSGSSSTLSAPSTAVIRLTNASLVSIAGITSSSSRDGDQLILVNDTGVDVDLLHQSGSASANDRIDTGISADALLRDEESCIIERFSSSSRWRVIGFISPT